MPDPSPAPTPLPDRVQCERALDNLMRSGEPLTMALLAFRDGRPFALRSTVRRDPGKCAAMSSSLAALSNAILRDIDQDRSELTLLEGAKGKIVLIQVPSGNNLLLLAVHAKSDANLGRILAYSKSCAGEIAKAFPTASP